MRKVLLLGAAAAALAAAPASAASFAGTGLPQDDAVFAGGFATASFTAANQSFASYTENGITISSGRIDKGYANNYNSFGSYYDNNAGEIGAITFSFASAVDAFAFNWGAADNDWNVELFAGATSLASYVLSPTFSSNAKGYFGFTGSGITSAVLTNTTDYDYVFVDNLTIATGDLTAAVPEPSTWAMLLLGFFAVGGTMRSASRRQKATVSYA